MRTPMRPWTQLLLGCAIAVAGVGLVLVLVFALLLDSLKTSQTVGGRGVIEITSPTVLREELTVECEWMWRIPPTIGHINLRSGITLGDSYVLWVTVVLPDVEVPEIEGDLAYARSPSSGVLGSEYVGFSEVDVQDHGRIGSAAFAAPEYHFDDGTGRVAPAISGRVTWACGGGPRLQ